MHVIVVGCGRVGSGLAALLDAEGHSVAIIDKNPSAFRRLPESFSGDQLTGLGFDRDVLHAARITEASALAAVTSGDNSNVLTARIAKETFEIPHVVARIYDPRRAVIYQRLGIATVATVSWTIDQVRRRLFASDTAHEWTDATGSIHLVERTIPSSWAGKRLDQVEGDGWKVVALTRGGVAQLSRPDLIAQAGDVVHLLARADAVATLDGEAADTTPHH